MSAEKEQVKAALETAPRMRIFVVDRESAAWKAIQNTFGHRPTRDGAIIALSSEEFESFKESVLAIDVR